MNCTLGTAQMLDQGRSTTNPNVTVRQFMLESVCMISILNPPAWARHLLHSLSLCIWNIYPLESRGEVLRRQCGGSAVTALEEGGVEERTAEAFDHV